MVFFLVFSRRSVRRRRRLGFLFGQLLCSLRSLWGSLLRRLALQSGAPPESFSVRVISPPASVLARLNELISSLLWPWAWGCPRTIGTARGPCLRHAKYIPMKTGGFQADGLIPAARRALVGETAPLRRSSLASIKMAV